MKRPWAKRLVLAAIAGTLIAAPMVTRECVPAPQQRPLHRGAEHRTDVGFLRINRPEIVRAGRPWTTETMRESSDRRLIAYVLRLADRFARQKHAESIMPVDEAARWAWAMERSYAGWRSVEDGIERGRSARDWWDIHRGLTAGFVLNAIGFTVYTAGASTVIYYVDLTNGSDAANGLTTGTAKKTVANAASVATPAHPDWILVKRGSTRSGLMLDNVSITGLDADNPCRIGSYGSGARAVHDVGSSGGVLLADSTSFVHITDQEIYSSTYTGHAVDKAAFQVLAAARGIRIENCVFHHMTTGIVAQNSGASRPTDLSIRRCYVHDCFCADLAQKGVGLFIGGVDRATIEENYIDHCGWNEDRATLTGTAGAVVGSTVVLTGGSALDDAYNGRSVAIATIGTFTITDYVGATAVATLDAPPTGATGKAFTVTGAAGRDTTHNTYVHQTNSGMVVRRNISTRASNHGIGRCNGQVYQNYIQACPTAVIAHKDTAESATDAVYENCVFGCTQAEIDVATYNGVGSLCGYDVGSPESTFNCYGNTVSSCFKTAGAQDMWGIGVNPDAAGTQNIYGNCGYNWSASGDQHSGMLRIQGANETYNVYQNKLQQIDYGNCVKINGAGGSETWNYHQNTYHKATNTNSAFEDPGHGAMSYATWASNYTETGSSFSNPAFTAPTRNLQSHTGQATLALAFAAMVAFDQDTWTEATNGVVPLLNHVRAGFDMAALPLVYGDQGDVENGRVRRVARGRRTDR